ncbi:hypothetical protein SCLCIDRAFT_19108 [Scleroderma citrinum Foug A]|uniref:Uncharacterized protein n=1 Tax=Scleroderma citrinum Foug A TaxID=1036808 RepID=A0A0C3EQV2_9AGAM|nr:hypothetical protein SCLCIDRAFT_19108 [Scleroderma citrinum Foug A]
MDKVELHGKQGQNACDLDTGAQRFHRDDVSHAQCHNGDKDEDYNSDGSDDEARIHNGPCVLNYVRLAKTPARKYPSSLYALAHHIQQPKLPLLTRRFLHFQLQNNVDPNNDNVALPDLSGLPFSVFHSATSTFYAPSDLSGLGGMHSECIWSTPSWRKGPARYDTVFLEKDPEIPGMGGLHIGRVFLFFSFTYDGIKYPCALIQWYTTFSDRPDEDMRMWIVQPDFDADGERELEVIHAHCILRGAHLIPVYGRDHLPSDLHYTDTLNIFHAYYVNKYIDHHAFEIAF